MMMCKTEEDIISYCILPDPALAYFKWRATPPSERSEIPAETELKKLKEKLAPQPVKVAESSQTAPVDQPTRFIHPEDVTGLLGMLRTASAIGFNELTVRRGEASLTMRVDGTGSQTVNSSESVIPAVKAPSVSEAPAPVKPPEPDAAGATPSYSRTVNSPIVGTFYSAPGAGKLAFVKIGDIVNSGDKVCIVEAMKLFNEIVAPVKCKIVGILAADGQRIEKDQPLIAIEEV
jgi:acetyl-CoA carboxylase biotin carboxyl carrier protein